MNTNIREQCRKDLIEHSEKDIEALSYIADKHFDGLLRGWLRKIKQRSDDPEPHESFIYLWFIFNSWLSRIAPDPDRNDVDAYLIKVIAGSKRFETRFTYLTSSNPEFKEWTKELVSLGPIFRVSSLKKEGIGPWNSKQENREGYVSKILESKNKIKLSPKCFEYHHKEKVSIPTDWPHTIWMIYQIRCNLFHGGKSFDSTEDSRFVKLALKVLWTIFKEEDFIKDALSQI